MNQEYYTDPKFRKTEIIKMFLFFPIFGTIIYLISLTSLGGNEWISVLLLLPIGLYGFWQIFNNSKNRPSVIIAERGITINNPAELEEISWNEIVGITVENKFNRQILYLDLKNEPQYKNVLSKVINKRNEKVKAKLSPKVGIMEKYVSYKIEELQSVTEEQIN
ncbi:hypothetical protein DNU06_15790 [Putridiphycobacter roseus]|uniref:PH domain-containing protein n=1 Tax=Putridiphycobacter roseus TaxID=2219161 RepID=A0A2W1MZ47_9FLAO|nr:STM3941 family protein [Putridiphycobacter roseus]PZE15841.1 hypothetical protein DNU06_15790 [Putridiphycobacter roseus]